MFRNLKLKNPNLNYFEYFYILNDVEKQHEELLNDNPAMIELVIGIFKEKGYDNQELLEKLKKLFLLNNPYSIDELGKDILYIDDVSLYNDTVEKIFQEGLEKIVQSFVHELSDREQDIIRQIFENEETLQEIGSKYNVTRQAIGSTKQKILKNLKKKLVLKKNKEAINSYLENNNHEYSDNKNSIYIRKH